MVNNVNNTPNTNVSAEELKKQQDAKKQQEAKRKEEAAKAEKSSSTFNVDVSGTYSQDTVRKQANNVSIHTQAKTQKSDTTKIQTQKNIAPTKSKNTGATGTAAAKPPAPVATKKTPPVTAEQPAVTTVSTPPSIVKTGKFNPPEVLQDFQVLKMEEKQNPIADEGGIRFYAPNSEDKNAESAKITSKVIGENTIISIGSGKNATNIKMPNDMVEKNKANGAAIIYDQKTDTYAFCNIEGAKVELPYQEANRSNSFSDAKNVKGEKVFIQSCKGCSFDSQDMSGVASGGRYEPGASKFSNTGQAASSGSSEAFAVFDSDVNIKASGGQDKVYAQNSTVSIEQSLGKANNKASVVSAHETRAQDNVMIATDGNSKINVDYDTSNSTNTMLNSQVYQQGFDAATFVPGWFGTDAKTGAQKEKVTPVASTAQNDGSASVAKTGTFAADSRFPEFSGLNMQNQTSFRTAGGISFFAPNETDPNVLKDLVNVKDTGTETIITIKNQKDVAVLAEDGTNTKNHQYSTIVIQNSAIDKNKANGASVVFDPKTQTYAYCNISDAKIVGTHQSKNYNTIYADNFAYNGKPKLQTEGEKVYMRNCSNVTVDSNDLISLSNDHTWNNSRNNEQTASLIGSGSKESYVAIGCNGVTVVTGGDGDTVQVEDSGDITVRSATTNDEEAKLYSQGSQILPRHKKHLQVSVSADAGSSVTLSAILTAANKIQ